MTKRDVAVLIFENDKNQILLQHRDASAPRFANMWGFFGGGLKNGELPIEALFREIKEELNINVAEPVEIWRQAYEIPENNESGTEYVFLAHYSNENIILSEGGELAWMKIVDALKLNVNPVDRKVLEFMSKKS